MKLHNLELYASQHLAGHYLSLVKQTDMWSKVTPEQSETGCGQMHMCGEGCICT